MLPPELPGGALRDAGPAMGAQADSGFWAAASVLTMLVLAVLDSAALQVVLPTDDAQLGRVGRRIDLDDSGHCLSGPEW